MTADYFDAGFLAIKDEVMKVVTPITTAAGITPEGQPPPKRPPHAARRVQAAAGAVTAALALPMQLMNDGFALATAGISNALPPFPAATMGALYMGPPHPHTHPPSWVPPVPPIPLPSIGTVLIGCSFKVFINNLPAARCGDIGLAVTCCGLIPLFEIKTGSSKVFIGGNRAARAIDYCLECAPGSAGMNGLAIAAFAAGAIATGAGVVADAQEGADAVSDQDDALASAKAMDAAASAAQLAIDAATIALKATLGKDIASPPVEGLIVLGNPGLPKVWIGGFPMPAMPDPMQKLFEKLKAKLSKPPRAGADEGKPGCTTCPK